MKYENFNGFIQRREVLPITRVGGRRIATPAFATVLHFTASYVDRNYFQDYHTKTNL